jgi:multidrug efflux pump subunit AcrA (membrane-fusion protein)
LISCKSAKENNADSQPEGSVPVTTIHPSYQPLANNVELNATSVFLVKTYVKSNTNGYLKEVFVRLGGKTGRGKKMFLIRSKESENLGNSISSLDPSFRFKGLVSILSPCNGYVTQLNYQSGDYVQDGETLATICDMNSLVFMLDLPYELKSYLNKNKIVDLILSDGKKLKGILTSPMPVVDPVSQTLSYIIKVSKANSIPENLVAKVVFIKNKKANALSLPKEAILTNDTQSAFWIMKMIDNTTAVKVFVKKGIETDKQVEILSPDFQITDNILLTGNYGLPDTAKVTIENK